jgi:hypothetical protein
VNFEHTTISSHSGAETRIEHDASKEFMQRRIHAAMEHHAMEPAAMRHRQSMSGLRKTPWTLMRRTALRTPACWLLLPLLVLVAAPAVAQIHKVTPPEKVTRAVGVYEWTGDLAKPTAARLVPVSLFINGHLEDAGLYLSQPMPFALQTGVVFTLEQAGKPEGSVTLDYARNVLPPGATTDVAAVGAWYGYGAYAPPAKPKPSTLKASAKVAPIDGGLPDDTDDKPHFVGKQPGQGNGADPGAASGTKSSASANGGNPAPADDPDRPHMNRRSDAASDTASSTTASATPDAANPAPDDDPDRPTLRHRDLPPPDQPKGKKQKQGDSAVIPMDVSLNDDPNRPTMQRGKPAGGVTAAPELRSMALSAATPGQPQLDLQQRVAVSDAANREPHEFSRPWETHTEHAEVLAKMQALAMPLLAKYEAAYKLNAPAATAGALATPSGTGTASSRPHAGTTAKSTRMKAARSAVIAPELDKEMLTGYELQYGGLPTFVYQAQSPVAVGGPVFVTLIAQRLPSGEFQIALANVTDAAHLDRTPRLRLIDAVDPDASHRASLLFEQRAASTRQFALYRLVTAHAEQQFITAPMQ